MENSSLDLPFGTDPTGRYYYRMICDAFGLLPHSAEPPTTTHKVLPSYFLGLNDDVYPANSPPHQRARRATNRSTASAESDDIDKNG
ncbi:hypothetical protein NKR19_g5635 [Coniochaeta hoffmannii]|uniref:Uncharacterized protein n=1 Tax=Coniochaeta hoffmannii TaxID=91930 RepID=A0AA38VSM2_9PEZI|nr:hypothetical protein NKR19_g5635 [Coniochaeta hoffmannii]